jgi:hypothetical protein
MYSFMHMRVISGLICGLFLTTMGIVCSAQPLSLSGDSAGTVVSMTGQVSVLRDGEPWGLNPGDKVQIQQVIVTGPDGFAKFQVSDGSFFEVYPNSNVVFRKNPGNLHDLLDLIVGRVKIHIQKWGGQPNPNRILTPTAVISVRGTTFDVNVDDDDQTTLVTVEEGAVDVYNPTKPTEPKRVNAGESIEVYKNVPVAHTIDKGDLTRRALRMLADAARVAMTQASHTATSLPGAPGVSGQTPPPPPPSTLPPPPPGH